jgi:GNAT superfamily N-acetyltransferase
MSKQRTLSLDFREFDPGDYERLVGIYNANYPDYTISIAERRSRDESLDRSHFTLRRFTCFDREADTIVGFGEISHLTDMFHPRKFMANILVNPEHQGKGVGSAIYDRLNREFVNLNAIVVWTMIKEDLTQRIDFFGRRGFREKTRNWESRLDLSRADPEAFRKYVEKATREGITFKTLAEEQRHGQDSLKKIHELVQLITADMPREAPFTPVSYEQWEALSLRNPRLIPEGYMIAKDGSKYVGMSNVFRSDTEPQSLYQDDTGVIREYRGRGIATALKLKVIEFGKSNGYETVKTWNDSVNAPMLAVNTKLGFKRQIGWIMMEKILHTETSS